MKHLCERLIEDARYLESAGLLREQLSQLHHFSRRGGQVSFAQTYAYFGVNKELRRTNRAFAERLRYVASEHQRSGHSFSALIRQALSKWPL